LSIGIWEIIVILLVAFVVVGPKDLPKIARALGKGVREIRNFYGEVSESIAAKDEVAAINDVKKEIEDGIKTVNTYNPKTIVKKELDSLNPLSGINEEIKDLDNIKNELTKKNK